MAAEVVYADDDFGVWLCKLCGVTQCYTIDTVEAAAAAHVCVQGGIQHWVDRGEYYRTCYGDGRVLFAEVYRDGWQPLRPVDGLPFELCNAYWAPAQGGACDLPKLHDGDHHV